MARKKKEKEVNKKEENILLPEKIESEDIKGELKTYIDERINVVFIEELEKTNKKLVREKSRRIFWKNIFIVILLLIIGFLISIPLIINSLLFLQIDNSFESNFIFLVLSINTLSVFTPMFIFSL